ncbi:CGNR zinc finger domain-containing protein [Nonomuraea salmonea]|uniref:CGNR zinc finger domain-containing protein n=1 Tax=Nonomuraea salmonea TaxID=46181 RepID=UPI0031F099C2
MLFDSHVAILLDTAVAMVNALTDGHQGSRPYAAPKGGRVAGRDRGGAAGWGGGVRGRGALPGRHHAQGAPGVRGDGGRAGGRRRRRRQRPRRQHRRPAAARPGAWRAVAGALPRGRRHARRGLERGLRLRAHPGHRQRPRRAARGVPCRPPCDRVYVDSSRNAVRQFCSRSCQSRVKAAAFRARTRPT